MNINYKETEEIIRKTLKEVGSLLKEGFLDANKHIEYKGKKKNDWLTNYDLKSEEIIVKCLNENWSSFNILTEEKKSSYKNSEYTWIIDPIDGTINFTRGIRDFAIGVSLARRNEVIMSFVYLPMYDEFYSAQKGNGAYCNHEPICVSNNNLNTSDIDISIFNSDILSDCFFNLITDIRYFKSYYCVIYSLMLVASGKIDALISYGCKAWDYASYLIVEEAGGTISDFKGEKFDISKNMIIASNNIIHNEILQRIKK